MPLCFAIMPITTPADVLPKYGDDPNHFIRVSKHIFKPAAEAAGFEFRAPASTSAVVIQAEIIEYLEKADLVLCDISTWNANVFFELGIRVALDRPVAMVKDHMTDRIPFDNSMVNTHTYDGRLDVWRVEETIPALTEFISSAKNQGQNALWKYFGITQRASRTDPGNPEDAKLDLLLAEMESLRRETADLRQLTSARPRRPLPTVFDPALPRPTRTTVVTETPPNLPSEQELLAFKNELLNNPILGNIAAVTLMGSDVQVYVNDLDRTHGMDYIAGAATMYLPSGTNIYVMVGRPDHINEPPVRITA